MVVGLNLLQHVPVAGVKAFAGQGEAPKPVVRRDVDAPEVEHQVRLDGVQGLREIRPQRVEIRLVAGCIVEGHVEKAQVVPRMIRDRHDDLAAEMEARGFNHDSPLEGFDPDAMLSVPQERMDGIHEANRGRLRRGCDDCTP